MSRVAVLSKKMAMVAAGLALGLSAILPVAAAAASDPSALYAYQLDGSSSSIANQGNYNTSTTLNLDGDWSQSDFGVHFTGNLVDQESVAYAGSPTQRMIKEDASEAVGFAVKIRYAGPVSGTCNSDSHNIAQIGKFKEDQLKLQLSSCSKSTTSVFPQCRITGDISPTQGQVVTGTQALVDGEAYVIGCMKTPDASGKTTVTVRTEHISADGNQVTSDNFVMPATGRIAIADYLSLANQYPRHAYSKNTDQFIGDIAAAAFCANPSTDTALACLATEVPATVGTVTTPTDPTPPPPPSDPVVSTDTVIATGTADQSGVLGASWRKVNFSISQSGQTTFSLDWSGSADLRFNVRNSAGTVVASNVSGLSPATATADLPAGDYSAAIWAYSGSADFTFSMSQQ
jgi:hypothetical protein